MAKHGTSVIYLPGDQTFGGSVRSSEGQVSQSNTSNRLTARLTVA